MVEMESGHRVFPQAGLEAWEDILPVHVLAWTAELVTTRMSRLVRPAKPDIPVAALPAIVVREPASVLFEKARQDALSSKLS